MSTTRFFNASSYNGKRSAASEMMRKQLKLKGKLGSTERFKAIAQQKLEEHRKMASLKLNANTSFSLPGTESSTHKISKNAELMLKQMAEKKAAKKAKAERQRVIVQPRSFSTGYITNKGRISDIAGNSVAKVNIKNGKIMLTAGMGGLLGKYKPESRMMTNMIIQDAINKYSPYYINLRKMQEMQRRARRRVGFAGASEVINIYGAFSRRA